MAFVDFESSNRSKIVRS